MYAIVGNNIFSGIKDEFSSKESNKNTFTQLEKFLEKNPKGGMHHICYEVDDIYDARDQLIKNGAKILGSGEPSVGAHDKPVLFLHPRDFCGTLIEIEQK